MKPTCSVLALGTVPRGHPVRVKPPGPVSSFRSAHTEGSTFLPANLWVIHHSKLTACPGRRVLLPSFAISENARICRTCCLFIRLNEAVTLRVAEPFNLTSSHLALPQTQQLESDRLTNYFIISSVRLHVKWLIHWACRHTSGGHQQSWESSNVIQPH